MTSHMIIKQKQNKTSSIRRGAQMNVLHVNYDRA